MEKIALPIKDAFIIQHPRYGDKRGFLEELYNQERYPDDLAVFFPVQQVTSASSFKNVVRGLHLSTYCKLLSVIRGSLYDVVVDLRSDSPTYLRWAGALLTDKNQRQLFIPPNCGHGYLSLEDDTVVVYCQGGCFRPETDFGMNPFDKLVNVCWTLENGGDGFILSDKDQKAKLWKELTPDVKSIPDARKRVLIIGENSQTGLAIRQVFEDKNRYLVYGTTHTIDYPFSMKLNLSTVHEDSTECKTVLDAVRPNIVIICAAFSHVDGCETDPEKSENINIKGTQILMDECELVGSTVVYLSTNYVFSEEIYKSSENNIIANNGLKETGRTDPLNVYAQHKLQTEGHILRSQSQSIVVRTSNVYGPSVAGRNNNFVYQMSRAMRNQRKYVCSTTETVVPTFTYDIANSILGLVEHSKSGLYHVCGPEAFSKYDWAMNIANILKLSAASIERLDGIMPSPTARPQGAVMSTEKLRESVPGIQLHTFSQGMAAWMKLNHGEPL